jgi:hypothetical protein
MINIDIKAWIVGATMVFTAAIAYATGERVISPLIDFAHTQTLPATAWDVIDLTLGVWRPVMILMAVAGLAYIVYSSIPMEREQQYGGRFY